MHSPTDIPSNAPMSEPTGSPSHMLRRTVVLASAGALIVAGAGTALALGGSSTTSAAGTSAAGTSATGTSTVGTTSAVAASTSADQSSPSWPGRVQVLERIAGTLTNLSTDTVTITGDTGASRSWPLSKQAAQRFGSAAVQKWLASNKIVGQRVVVAIGSEGGQNVALTVIPMRAHVRGTVTAVSGTTYTVVDMAGFSRTVDRSGVLKAPTLVVGDQVLAVGTVAPNGTTLVATTLVKNPQPAHWRGMMGGGDRDWAHRMGSGTGNGVGARMGSGTGNGVGDRMGMGGFGSGSPQSTDSVNAPTGADVGPAMGFAI